MAIQKKYYFINTRKNTVGIESSLDKALKSGNIVNFLDYQMPTFTA